MANKIKHREPSETTKKQVLAACGNQCAFPACSDIIVDRDHAVLVGKIAHIKARSEGGPRFDRRQSEVENRSAANLVALCGKHHDIVDQRDDMYKVEQMTALKIEHEEKIESSADRSWIRFPNFAMQQIEGFQTAQFHYWVDRTGRPRIYTDRQLAIARTAFDIYQDINSLCQLYEMVESNPEAPGKSFMQSYVTLKKSRAALHEETKWTPIAQILCQMAEIPEVTFGELVTYLVEGNDATKLFQARAKVFEEKMRTRKAN